MTKAERQYQKDLQAYLQDCEKKFRENYGKDKEDSQPPFPMETYKKYAKEYLMEPWPSKATQIKNRVGVEKFIDFMDSEGYTEVSPETVMKYRSALGVYAPNTVSQYMGRLSASLNWMVEMGYLERNPIPKSMKQRERYNEAKPVLSEDELNAVLNPNNVTFRRKVNRRRNRAIVVLMVTSGIRRNELLSLLPTDLNWNNGTLTVRSGKGGKGRVAPFIPLAQNVVKEYMEFERPKAATKNDPLFVREEGGKIKPISRSQVYNIITGYIWDTTGRDDLSPHSLRHSFASFLVSNGINASDLQELLGHSSLLITQRYAQLLHPDEAPSAHAAETFSNLMYTKRMKQMIAQESARK